MEKQSQFPQPEPGKYRPLRLSRGMKIFHRWMAGLSALFLFAIPIIIGIIPPIDYKTDDLLFSIGVGSVLVGVAALMLWGYQSVVDWFDRRSNAPSRKSTGNQ